MYNICFVTQSCMTPCDLMDCSPPDSSVHGILQARILEWVAISFSRGSSWPEDWAISFSRGSSWPEDWTWIFYVSCRYVAGRFFTTATTWKAPCIIYPCGFYLFKIFGGGGGSFLVFIEPVCNIASALCFDFLAARHAGLAPWPGIAPAPPELEGEAQPLDHQGSPSL